MRSRGRVRRHRPGRRGTGGPGAEGPEDGRFRSLRRGHARGVRHRVPVAPGARRRRLRAQVPAGDLDRAAAARQAAGGGRAEDRLRRPGARLHGQGQRPGALRADLQGAGAAPAGDRAVARVGHQVARGRHRLRRQAQRADLRDHQEDLQPRPQHLAHLARGRRAGRPGQRRARRDLDADQEPQGGARQARRRDHRLRGGQAGFGQRAALRLRRQPARNAEPDRRRARRRAHRPGREPLRRHEVARLLRDAGRQRSSWRRIANWKR